MKEKLILFLTKHDALDKFKANLAARGDICSDFDVYLEDNNFDDMDGAFTWDNTPEGFDYWNELSYKWKN